MGRVGGLVIIGQVATGAGIGDIGIIPIMAGIAIGDGKMGACQNVIIIMDGE